MCIGPGGAQTQIPFNFIGHLALIVCVWSWILVAITLHCKIC